MQAVFWILLNTSLALFFSACLFLWILRSTVGWYLRRKNAAHRNLIIARVKLEESQFQLSARPSPKSDDGEWEKLETSMVGSAPNGEEADDEWEGIIGFLHPFCNAGGGGERVLWAAINATQQRWPKAVCVVYTGDYDVSKEAIIQKVQNRFNIYLHPPTIVFLDLSTRYYVLSSTYPYLTLLGQSLGSILLACDAYSLVIPDVFVDTMGYAFALGFSKLLFPSIPTGAYVHYPTISTDMLGSLDVSPSLGKGLNAGAGKGLRGVLKKQYWHLFAKAYSFVGGSVDVVMTNSSWTASHICQLWGPSRAWWKKPYPVSVVFPPVAVEELIDFIPLDQKSESQRQRNLLCIAQFRPEKNHTLLLRSFARLLKSKEQDLSDVKLILIGSVRDAGDATRVYDLRLLAHELQIKTSVSFITDASWDAILAHLQTASIGVNCMWNEHFGIGVVEYQAAGLLSVVNDSGGPKLDIVVPWDGGETGFKASTEEEYAAAFQKALSMEKKEMMAMRMRARSRAERFTETEFEKRWVGEMGKLVEMTGRKPKRR